MHYSYRQHNGKWAATQKQVLIEKIVDRGVTNQTPPFIEMFTDFTLLGIDKPLSQKMADYYRETKTYPKVIATTGDDETLTLHYFRSSLRTQAVSSIVVTTVVDGQPAARSSTGPSPIQ